MLRYKLLYISSNFQNTLDFFNFYFISRLYYSISNCKKLISSLRTLIKFVNASHYTLQVKHRLMISLISYDNSVKSKDLTQEQVFLMLIPIQTLVSSNFSHSFQDYSSYPSQKNHSHIQVSFFIQLNYSQIASPYHFISFLLEPS